MAGWGVSESKRLKLNADVAIGRWEITKDFHIHLCNRPPWRTRQMMKIFFGWKWVDL
jgi:hypothetical protein